MTNIPKELQQKIEREAEVWAFSGKWSNNNDEAGDNFGSYQKGALSIAGSYQKGAQSIAVQLAKAVEALKWAQKKSAHMKSDHAFEINRKTTVALEEYERWMNESNT